MTANRFSRKVPFIYNTDTAVHNYSTLLLPNIQIINIILQIQSTFNNDDAFNSNYLIGKVYMIPSIKITEEIDQFVINFAGKLLANCELETQAYKVIIIL